MSPHDLISNLTGPADLAGSPFGADLFELVAALKRRGGLGVYVARDDKQAATALKLVEFAAPALERLNLPGWDILPYDRISPTPSISARRCAALARLAGRSETDPALLVVTTASALVQRVPPREVMNAASLSLAAGDTLSQQRLTDYLGVNGYVRASTVRERGDYAIRGGLVDIWPPTSPDPLRLDFFGDTLETLRQFDAETQRTTARLASADLAPVSEILFNDEVLSRFREAYLTRFGPPAGDTMYEAARASIRRQGLENWLPLFHPHLETLFDYFGPRALIGIAHLAGQAATERLNQAADYHAARLDAAGSEAEARVLAPDALYLAPAELEAALAGTASLRFSPAATGATAIDLGAQPGRDFALERARPDLNIFEAATAHASQQAAAGRAVVFAAWTGGSAERLVNVMEDHGLSDLERVYSLEAARTKGLSVAELPLEQGFVSADLCVIAEPDILGDRLAAPRRKRKAANFIAETAALAKGDLVVHVDHGVGRYEGLRTLDLSGAPHDCIELEYSGGDRIFLPVENIDLISRYGSEDATGMVDKLGGANWQARKAKAKKRILEMASELMDIAAQRALRTADPLSPGQGMYEEFAARFPYEETDDQLNAIADVMEDFAAGRPMDRLICGDVGFGKTEVALRAAFVAAMSGQQVAVIAPTTLLARQHYQTFSERFAGWPMEVRQLSRLVSARDATATRDGLTSGKVDIVVGTHALLADAIQFNRLGLVIVDEEQRFGVKHKERLKELRADVHVLTLSATPDPADPANGADRHSRSFDHCDAAGRSPRGAHLCHRVRHRHPARSPAAREVSRRPGLHRRPAGCRS